jgi:GTP-binding protein
VIDFDSFANDEEKSRFEDFTKWLFSQPCRFLLSVASLSQLPEPDLAEIAFAGRSNVGKSSLLNALVAQKDLARASNTPGRTQFLNFFNLAERLMIVDLPGYGFAKAPKDIVESWTHMLKLYLKGRPSLKRVYLLIDSRHGIKEKDLEMMKMLDESAVSYQIILTKADKISDQETAKILSGTIKKTETHGAAFPRVLITSAQKLKGIEDLRREIAMLVFNKEG